MVRVSRSHPALLELARRASSACPVTARPGADVPPNRAVVVSQAVGDRPRSSSPSTRAANTIVQAMRRHAHQAARGVALQHRGHISRSCTDHASPLKFIKANWGLKPITNGSRDNLPNPRTGENPYVPQAAGDRRYDGSVRLGPIGARSPTCRTMPCGRFRH